MLNLKRKLEHVHAEQEEHVRKVKKVKSMAVDFSAFDEKVDLESLQKEVQEAPDNDFDDVPDG